MVSSQLCPENKNPRDSLQICLAIEYFMTQYLSYVRIDKTLQQCFMITIAYESNSPCIIIWNVKQAASVLSTIVSAEFGRFWTPGRWIYTPLSIIPIMISLSSWPSPNPAGFTRRTNEGLLNCAKLLGRQKVPWFHLKVVQCTLPMAAFCQPRLKKMLSPQTGLRSRPPPLCVTRNPPFTLKCHMSVSHQSPRRRSEWSAVAAVSCVWRS